MKTRIILIVITLIIVTGSGFYLFSKELSVGFSSLAGKLNNMAEVRTPPVIQEGTKTIRTESEDSDTDEELDEENIGNVKVFTVKGSNYEYSPKQISVKKGDTVKIVFVNTVGLHDFVIDELDLKTDVIKAGESESVQFVADTAGTFTYYCSVGNHRKMGMEGILTVL